MPFTPFSSGDLSASLDGLLRSVHAEIDQLDSNYVLRVPPAELDEYYIAKALLTPLTLHVDQQYIAEQRTIQVDVSYDFRRAIQPGSRAHVPGTRLEIDVPYSGTSTLWKLRPSTFSLSGYPNVHDYGDRIGFSVEFPDDSSNPQVLKKEIDDAIASLSRAVENQRREVERHNENAPQNVKARIQSKRAKAADSCSAVADLGIPIKRRDQPAAYAVPVSRRPELAKPKASADRYEPEPILEAKEYDHILGVLRSMALVIERNPQSFASLDEESVRDHFLLQLNGHYQGAATGETFNASGKTDILIRERHRNVFIAECKFWRGSKGFHDAIDQLLGYLTWRDCKCALLIFNRNRDSTSVSQKMHEAIESRAEHKKTVSRNTNGEARYVFEKTGERNREIQVTTLLFDVQNPSPETEVE